MRTALLFIVIILSLSNRCFAQDMGQEVEAHLTQAQLNDFKDQAARTIRSLSDFVTKIGDKSQEPARRKASVTSAVKLFMTDTNIVQVSSLYKKVPDEIKVRDYFRRLLDLPYTSVNIKWYDVYFSSDFSKGEDGRYYAAATVYQKFEGYTGKEFGGKPYIDITIKNIKIIIAREEEHIGDRVIEKWRLFLGDINVEETRQ
jgi:hypothetical protein